MTTTDEVVLREVRLPDGRGADVRLSGGVIDEISNLGQMTPRSGETVFDAEGRILLPAPADPHAHLDKTLTADVADNRDGDLPGAIQAWQNHCENLTADDVYRRARRAALTAVRHGVTAIRSHVDIWPEVGLTSLEALAQLRADLREVVDIQLCVLTFPLSGAGGAAGRELVRSALTRGADLVGGVPHVTEDPGNEMVTGMELARSAGCGVDFHTDEHLRSSVDLRDLAHLAREFDGDVTASHCASLGMTTVETQQTVASEASRAGVGVVCCPQTNLYLQGRQQPRATPRGITALQPLLRAGVTVAAGGDNVQDPFNPLGRGDPLETAALLVTTGHLTPDDAYRCVSSRARTVMGLPGGGITSGTPAELVVIAAGSVREAIATSTEDRMVIHGGRPVARTRVSTDLRSDAVLD